MMYLFFDAAKSITIEERIHIYLSKDRALSLQ